MSQRACELVQRCVVPTPSHTIVQFLKATIGYSRNDCTTQLSRSQAGVQFLALAAALIPTMPSFDASNAVRVMLEASATDKRLLPTTHQIKGLLTSLEPRCHTAGFVDDVIRWQSVLKLADVRETEAEIQYSTSLPTSEGLQQLVDGFRQLARVGETSVTKVSIRTSCCTPWAAAFTEWCLGVAPSVFMDDGRPIVQNPDSPVVITTMRELSEYLVGFEVAVHHGVKGPRDLAVDCGSQGEWGGVASMASYGKWLFHNYELDTEENKRAVKEILPAALHLVMESMHLSRYNGFDHTVSRDQWVLHETRDDCDTIPTPMQGLRLFPHSGSASISTILSILTSGKMTKLHSLKPGVLLEQLSTSETLLRDMTKRCRCFDCLGGEDSLDEADMAPRDGTANTGFLRCLKKVFFQSISIVVADILALSLFHCPEDLRVRLPIPQHNVYGEHPFKEAIESILTTGESSYCDHVHMLDWALALAGHTVSDEVTKDLNWVMSCESGQAVWPTIYDSNAVEKRGFLSLSWARGELRYKDERYILVSGVDMPPMLNNVEDTQSEPVLQPCNLFDGLRTTWRLAVGDEVLIAGIGLTGMGGRYDFVQVSPCLLLANLAASLVVECCTHKRDAALITADQFSNYTGPVNPTKPAMLSMESNSCQIGVVAVEGAEDLRFFAAACGGVRCPLVLRKTACLSCCLDVCRRTGFPVLVL